MAAEWESGRYAGLRLTVPLLHLQVDVTDAGLHGVHDWDRGRGRGRHKGAEGAVPSSLAPKTNTSCPAPREGDRRERPCKGFAFSRRAQSARSGRVQRRGTPPTGATVLTLAIVGRRPDLVTEGGAAGKEAPTQTPVFCRSHMRSVWNGARVHVPRTMPARGSRAPLTSQCGRNRQH